MSIIEHEYAMHGRVGLLVKKVRIILEALQ